MNKMKCAHKVHFIFFENIHANCVTFFLLLRIIIQDNINFHKAKETA